MTYKLVLQRSDYPVIKGLLDEGMSQLRIAKQYGVCKSTILRVAQGKHWICKTDPDEAFVVEPKSEEDVRYTNAKQLVLSGVRVREALQETGLTKEEWDSRLAMEEG